MNTYSWAELLQLITDSWLRPVNCFGHPEWPMLFGDEIGKANGRNIWVLFYKYNKHFQSCNWMCKHSRDKELKALTEMTRPNSISNPELEWVHVVRVQSTRWHSLSTFLYQVTWQKFSKVSIWDKLWVTHLDKKLVLNSHTCHPLYESIPNHIST